jgi:glyoxylase-like metal-dependent hydrolase (beta-lactamase superfamily II)
MKILRLPLGQLQANCYFLIKDNQCLIIDPADEASFILEELERRKLKLIGMLATHGHFDHIMATGEIQLSLKTPFYISKEDSFLVKRLKETAQYFLGHREQLLPPTLIKYLKEGNFRMRNYELRIIHTPGHTPGSVSFYFKKEKVIFTGDTLFKKGIGRSDFSYSSKKDLDSSLKKIFKLPKETIIYPGHKEQTTILSACSSAFPSPLD